MRDAAAQISVSNARATSSRNSTLTLIFVRPTQAIFRCRLLLNRRSGVRRENQVRVEFRRFTKIAFDTAVDLCAPHEFESDPIFSAI